LAPRAAQPGAPASGRAFSSTHKFVVPELSVEENVRLRRALGTAGRALRHWLHPWMTGGAPESARRRPDAILDKEPGRAGSSARADPWRGDRGVSLANQRKARGSALLDGAWSKGFFTCSMSRPPAMSIDESPGWVLNLDRAAQAGGVEARGASSILLGRGTRGTWGATLAGDRIMCCTNRPVVADGKQAR